MNRITPSDGSLSGRLAAKRVNRPVFRATMPTTGLRPCQTGPDKVAALLLSRRANLLLDQRGHRNMRPVDIKKVQDDFLAILQLQKKRTVLLLHRLDPESGVQPGCGRIFL